MRSCLKALSLLLVANLFVACGDGGSDSSTVEVLEWPGEEWTVTTPAEQGMDAALIEEAFEYAFQDGKETQGVVVVKNGFLVAERYRDGADASTLATSWSAAKSFTSTMIGLAIGDGAIPSLDTPVSTFVPEWRTPEKEAITIRALLEMRSGLAWNEARDNVPLYLNGTDQLAFSTAVPVGRPPHEVFNYTSANSMILAEVVAAAVGTSTSEYAQERLFGPLGMTADWWVDGAGHTLGYCCVDTTTRDFARFGLLFARGGRWRDQRIVSQQWVEEVTRSLDGVPFYGLHWWLNSGGAAAPNVPGEMFAARGLHVQNIYVIPTLDLVVVRNSFYQRLGNGQTIRTGANLHQTRPPDSWDDDTFLGPIVRAIDPADVAAAH